MNDTEQFRSAYHSSQEMVETVGQKVMGDFQIYKVHIKIKMRWF